MVTNNAINEKTAAAGKVLQGQGVGVTSGFSTATYPATATGTGTILRADGTNWVATTATYPTTAGTIGNVLTSDGTNWSSSAPAFTFAPNSIIYLFDDFITCINGSAVLTSQLGWSTTSATPWTTALTASSLAANPGLLGNSAASATSAIYGCPTTSIPIILGSGAVNVNWVIKVATLSSTSPRYTLYVGLGDTFSGGDMANGVYFKYSDNLNSGNWVGNTAAGGSRNTANSAVAVINSAFVNLGITVNAAGTSASFLVNGVEIANSPIAATIPTLPVVPTVRVTASVGTAAANSVLIDLFYMTITLTTPR